MDSSSSSSSNWEKLLSEKYYNLKNPSAFSSVERLYNETNKKIPRKFIEKWLSGQLAYTLHRQVVRKFRKNSYIVTNIGDQHQADLMDMQSLSEFNDSYKYVLVIIDIFSRFAWTHPLKSKKSQEVIGALRKTYEDTKNRCRYFVTDRGSYAKTFLFFF